MLKLQDFAREKGVTDKAIYKHLQKHAEELEGHIERRGKNGTWLDEYAQEYISGLMITNPTVVSDNALQRRIDDLEKKLLEKEKYITVIETSSILKQERLNQFEAAQLLIEEKTEQKIKAAEDALALKLQSEYLESERKLKKQYEAEIEALKVTVEEERNKKIITKLVEKLGWKKN